MNRSLRGLAATVVALPALILPAAPSAFAQVSGATVSGTIRDNQGSLIPGARVELRRTSTGVTTAATTNGEGFYTLPNLTPGGYTVKVTAPGFAPKGTNLNLTVGDQVTLALDLGVGSVDQVVEIVDTPPSVELTSSANGATVTGPVIRELPLNGRSWTDLAALQPGVAGVTTQVQFDQGAGRGNRGFGAQLSISGARPTQNSYRLDGISINDYSNGGPGSVIGVNLGVDAVGEFSVLTSNYSAEYGKTSGGVVNAITRSGTNKFHGGASAFFRNSALDARKYFDQPGLPPPPFARYQYGAYVGGPIVKDRTFFFADFEAIKQNLATSVPTRVLSDAARAAATDPAVIKYLGLMPRASVATTDPNIGIYNFINQQNVTDNFVTGRIDHKLSAKDSLFGTYLFDNSPFTQSDAQGITLTGSKVRRQALILEESHIFGGSFINTVRFGLNRQAVANNAGVSAINPLATDTSLGVLPGRTAPGVNIPGIDRIVGGLGSTPAYNFRFTTFQAYDDAFLTRGTHAIKFGFAFERLQNNILAVSNPNGLFAFASVARFLNNTPTRLQAGFASTLTPRNLRQFLIGGYIQDDWHWKPNLTLNLGLRYEMVNVPTEVAGKLSALANITDAVPHLGNPYFANPTYKNFEPRVGFVLDPFANHRTSVHGGAGLYDVLPLLYQYEILSVLTAPYFVIGSTTNPAARLGADPAVVQTALLGTNPNFLSGPTLSQAYIDKPKRNYVMQYNLSVQHELFKDITFTIGYVGSHAVHQPFRVEEANIVLPTKTAQGYLWTGSTRLNPNAGTIRALWYFAGSNYNALQSDVTARIKKSLTMKASFTLGKSMDNGSATIAGDAFANSVPSLDFFDASLSYGRSDFDVNKIFVANAIYTAPEIESAHGLRGLAVNGWQVGGILKLISGTPFTPLIGGDPLGKQGGDPWDYPDRIPGCPIVNKNFKHAAIPLAYVNTACFPAPAATRLRGNAGRNSIDGPGLATFDVSLFKNNHIPRFGEQANVQFRAEAFNVLNRANFAIPSNTNQQFYNASFTPGSSVSALSSAGVLSQISTTARQLQFAVKLLF